MISTVIIIGIYLYSFGYQVGHVSSEGHRYVLTRSSQAHQASLSPAFDEAAAAIDSGENDEDHDYGSSSEDYFGTSERSRKKLTANPFKNEEPKGAADGGEARGERKKSSPRHVVASVFEQGETRHFLQFLRRINYDHRQFPENGGESVEVGVSIVVSNIRAVSEVTMDYALELFYRETWMDTRLFFDKRVFANKSELALHESYANFLWHPDTFMPNAIASKNPQKQSISHRSLLRLRDNGLVLYSRRISIIAECPMDLTLFPFDSQTCKLGIESYGYTADQVHYKWLRGNIPALTLQKIRLPDFQIRQAYVTSQLESYATGNYSRLYVCFVFDRASGFCFLQLIIPSTAVVITSWVALWMESETEFQDMISIILAITFLIFSYNEMMPRVSYLKALDVWLAVCFMTVFLSLIKLALVKYMRKKLRSGDLIPTVLCEVFNDGTANGNIQSANPITIQPPRLSGDYYANESDYSSEKNLLNPANAGRYGSEEDGGIPSMARRHSRVSLVNLRFNDTKLSTETTVINEKGVGSSKCGLIGSIIDTFTKVLSKRLRLTNYGMRRFHWASQMVFFFGFVTFALFYFLVYPSLHQSEIDNACKAENAETFAIIV